jgi:hypothetical protein
MLLERFTPVRLARTHDTAGTPGCRAAAPPTARAFFVGTHTVSHIGQGAGRVAAQRKRVGSQHDEGWRQFLVQRSSAQNPLGTRQPSRRNPDDRRGSNRLAAASFSLYPASRSDQTSANTRVGQFTVALFHKLNFGLAMMQYAR